MACESLMHGSGGTPQVGITDLKSLTLQQCQVSE